MLSPDGRWRWDGSQWVANELAPPPQPVPGAMPPPPGAAWGPPPIASRGLAYQFSGNALWSIIFGAVSVVVPLVTSFYLPILPLFGLWRGVLAIQRGRVAGGVVGLVLNVLGGLVSLLVSGLLFR
jgi:hypothetical protein